MDTIRILLMALPRMLGDIVRAAPDSDVRVVGEHQDPGDLIGDLDRVDANVVVFGADPLGLPAECRALLDRRPRVKVMVVRGDAQRATLFELRPHATPLQGLSPDELIAAIRSAVHDSAASW